MAYLDGKTWLRNSISIWSDIRKTKEEARLAHPALFPLALASRLIALFSQRSQVVCDPFAGVGTSILAAHLLGRKGIGIELSPTFAAIATTRYRKLNPHGRRVIFRANASHLLRYVSSNSVDLVITSPPYWNVLLEKREAAPSKAVRDYGAEPEDLGKIKDYPQFLFHLQEIFSQVYQAMKANSWCCVNVMDLRKQATFYPFHSDVAAFMQEIGFTYEDIIIWDRRREYNHLKPLGYPHVFRINKVHEYILLFRKRAVKQASQQSYVYPTERGVQRPLQPQGIRELLQVFGWTYKEKKRNKKTYVYARRRAGGKIQDRYLGTLERLVAQGPQAIIGKLTL